MNIPFADLKQQYTDIKPEIDEAIRQVLESTRFIGGQIVKDFETNFANYQKTKHCISCANGTDALEIALQALGVTVGDEVIVPAMTWISTAEAVSSLGAKPVFVDVDQDFYTMDVTLIPGKITEKTKAIIPVHLYGNPANMPEIMQLAERYQLKVIEDCAQAHGAKINEQNIGTFGDIATFSFYPGKNLGAYGDAGAITTDNDELADICKMIANHGQKGKHNHLMEGRNSRLDTLQAAILNIKLKHLPLWNEKREEKASYYLEMLKGNDQVILPQTREGYKHVYHVFALKVSNRNLVKDQLRDFGIATQIHYPFALPIMPAYKGLNLNISDYKNAISLGERELSLPLYPEITKEMMNYVVEKLPS